MKNKPEEVNKLQKIAGIKKDTPQKGIIPIEDIFKMFDAAEKEWQAATPGQRMSAKFKDEVIKKHFKMSPADFYKLIFSPDKSA